MQVVQRPRQRTQPCKRPGAGRSRHVEAQRPVWLKKGDKGEGQGGGRRTWRWKGRVLDLGFVMENHLCALNSLGRSLESERGNSGQAPYVPFII